MSKCIQKLLEKVNSRNQSIDGIEHKIKQFCKLMEATRSENNSPTTRKRFKELAEDIMRELKNSGLLSHGDIVFAQGMTKE